MANDTLTISVNTFDNLLGDCYKSAYLDSVVTEAIRRLSDTTYDPLEIRDYLTAGLKASNRPAA